MVESLEFLGKWADEKKMEANSSLFSKIGNVIKSCAKAVGSFISGNHEEAKKHMEEAKQKCAEISGKKLFQELDDLKTKSGNWVENIKQNNFNQQSNSRDN